MECICVSVIYTRGPPTQRRTESPTRVWPVIWRLPAALSRLPTLPRRCPLSSPVSPSLSSRLLYMSRDTQGAVVWSRIIPLSEWSGLCSLTFFTYVIFSGLANLCVQLLLRYSTLSLAFSLLGGIWVVSRFCCWTVLPGTFTYSSTGAHWQDFSVSFMKKAECRRIDAFELWCWRRLFRVPWTARRSNWSILKEISPGISLEGLMLKLKLQYFGHLMRRIDLLEKTLMLGGLGGRRKRG